MNGIGGRGATGGIGKETGVETGKGRGTEESGRNGIEGVNGSMTERGVLVDLREAADGQTGVKEGLLTEKGNGMLDTSTTLVRYCSSYSCFIPISLSLSLLSLSLSSL